MVALGIVAYDVDIEPAKLPAAIVTFLVGVATFAALGLAVAGLCPSASAAAALANVIILPMAFISDIFIALEDPPRWLDMLGDVLPLKPFAQSFQDTFNPAVDRAGLRVGQARPRRRVGRRRAARCDPLVQVGAFAWRHRRAASRSRRRRRPA